MEDKQVQNPEQLIESKLLYRGRAINIRVDYIKKHSGRETTREIVEHHDCVVVLPLDKNNKVLLVRQYRRAVDKFLLELPAGSIDPGEKPEETVIRELQEETGYRPEIVKRVGGFYVAPGYCTEYIHIFLATDLVPSRLTAEDTDEITVEVHSVPEALKLISDGSICDAKSIIGLLILKNLQVK